MIVDVFLLFEYWDNLKLIKGSLVCKNVLKSNSVEHILGVHVRVCEYAYKKCFITSGPGIGETGQR